MNTLERAARAVWQAKREYLISQWRESGASRSMHSVSDGPDTFDEEIKDVKDLCVSQARAVLMAVMHPDDDLIDRAVMTQSDYWSWQNTIQAILADGGE